MGLSRMFGHKLSTVYLHVIRLAVEHQGSAEIRIVRRLYFCVCANPNWQTGLG